MRHVSIRRSVRRRGLGRDVAHHPSRRWYYDDVPMRPSRRRWRRYRDRRPMSRNAAPFAGNEARRRAVKISAPTATIWRRRDVRRARMTSRAANGGGIRVELNAMVGMRRDRRGWDSDDARRWFRPRRAEEGGGGRSEDAHILIPGSTI